MSDEYENPHHTEDRMSEMSWEGRLDWAWQSLEEWAHVWEPVIKAVEEGADSVRIARLAKVATGRIIEETEGEYPFATLWSLGPASS